MFSFFSSTSWKKDSLVPLLAPDDFHSYLHRSVVLLIHCLNNVKALQLDNDELETSANRFASFEIRTDTRCLTWDNVIGAKFILIAKIYDQIGTFIVFEIQLVANGSLWRCRRGWGTCLMRSMNIHFTNATNNTREDRCDRPIVWQSVTVLTFVTLIVYFQRSSDCPVFEADRWTSLARRSSLEQWWLRSLDPSPKDPIRTPIDILRRI